MCKCFMFMFLDYISFCDSWALKIDCEIFQWNYYTQNRKFFGYWAALNEWISAKLPLIANTQEIMPIFVSNVVSVYLCVRLDLIECFFFLVNTQLELWYSWLESVRKVFVCVCVCVWFVYVLICIDREQNRGFYWRLPNDYPE